MEMKKTLSSLPIILLAASCTSVNVKQINSAKNTIEPICIKINKAVIVPEFLSILQDGIKRHNIEVRAVNEIDNNCGSTLTYTATRSWDVTPYLSHAELNLITNDGVAIGSASYHHNGGGMSLAPNKWDSAKSKLDPVIDELFENVK